MSPYVRRESAGDQYQVPGRNTPIPPSLRPGHNTGRRVSFASPPVQHGGSAYPQSEYDGPHRHCAYSAAAANDELHFQQPNPSYTSSPQYTTSSRPADAYQPGFSPPQYRTHSSPTGVHQPQYTTHPSPAGVHQQPGFPPQQNTPPLPPKRPEVLIIGLFALRLAKKLIRLLDKYPERDNDIAWINKFLSPYTRRDILAQITGERIEEYTSTYPVIVARFIKQPRYPLAFMELNPDRKIVDRRLTDQECTDLLDFADAAAEWGSTVKLPGMEAERFERLSERRRMAHF
jgi:hypothetical protein